MIPTLLEIDSLLSEERFSCLNYHDIAKLSQSEREVIVRETTDILDLFLQTIDYTHTNPEKDINLRNALWSWAEVELTVATCHSIASLDGVLELSATLSETYYPLASYEIKLSMAKGTALVITADSDFLPPHVKKSLPHSQMRIWQGLEPLDEWSSRFFGHIREAAELFGSNDPALGTLSASGWMRHIDGWYLENKISDITTTIQSPCSSSAGSEIGNTQTESSSSSSSSSSSQTDLSLFKACPVEDFPYYLRSITGTQIPYFVAIFKPTRGIEAPYPIWMSYVPALTTMINLGNDLLSFPKEVLAGETANYISLVTQMKRDAGYKSKFANDSLWTMRDSIQELFMRLVDSIRALDDGFADLLLRDCYCRSTEHKLLSQERLSRWSKSQVQLNATLWALFKQGYFAWHINSKRYGLDSLKSRFERA